MLTAKEQILNLIEKSHKILITFPPSPEGDAPACALALKEYLEKEKGKRVDIVCSGFFAWPKFSFLPGIKKIKEELPLNKKLTIKIDTSQKKVDSLYYDKEEDSLQIIVKALSTPFSKKEVSILDRDTNYDLVIVINAPDLDSLGEIFSQNHDLFYNTPLINIDHTPNNEHYGQINLVDLKASSAAELIFSLLPEKSINQEIAQLLLTGIIEKTNAFKSSQVTPKTFAIVSQLIKAGAQKEIIIKNLYQSYSLPHLKILGRILARLKEKENGQLAWSLLTKEDIQKTQSSESSIIEILNNLLPNLVSSQFLTIFLQKEEKATKVFIKSKKDYQKLANALEKFSPQISQSILATSLNEDLLSSEQKIIPLLESSLEE